MVHQIINIQRLVSDEQCYETVRGLRWPSGTRCPHCQSQQIINIQGESLWVSHYFAFRKVLA